jgi:hypothetical protein
MSVATPALDALRDALADEFKDTRLNLGAVLAGELLQPAQSLGVALAAARFLRCRPLADALAADLRGALGDAATPVISDAIAAAGLMAMNTVYYRFRHMLGKESYEARSPRLRGPGRLRAVHQEPRGQPAPPGGQRGRLPRRRADRGGDERGGLRPGLSGRAPLGVAHAPSAGRSLRPSWALLALSRLAPASCLRSPERPASWAWATPRSPFWRIRKPASP